MRVPGGQRGPEVRFREVTFRRRSIASHLRERRFWGVSELTNCDLIGWVNTSAFCRS
jgi:hypothetical protein